MTTAQFLRQQLIQEIDRLPEFRLQEVLDFVLFLFSQEKRGSWQQEVQARRLPLDNNPLLHLIGDVTHGALAQDIDEDLYGA